MIDWVKHENNTFRILKEHCPHVWKIEPTPMTTDEHLPDFFVQGAKCPFFVECKVMEKIHPEPLMVFKKIRQVNAIRNISKLTHCFVVIYDSIQGKYRVLIARGKSINWLGHDFHTLNEAVISMKEYANESKK